MRIFPIYFTMQLQPSVSQHIQFAIGFRTGLDSNNVQMKWYRYGIVEKVTPMSERQVLQKRYISEDTDYSVPDMVENLIKLINEGTYRNELFV